jgi:hypothetical protein
MQSMPSMQLVRHPSGRVRVKYYDGNKFWHLNNGKNKYFNTEAEAKAAFKIFEQKIARDITRANLKVAASE